MVTATICSLFFSFPFNSSAVPTSQNNLQRCYPLWGANKDRDKIEEMVRNRYECWIDDPIKALPEKYVRILLGIQTISFEYDESITAIGSSWIKGNPVGKVTLRYKYGDTYIGSVAGSKPNGTGEYYFLNGDRYEGEFLDGSFSGNGSYLKKSGLVYSGTWEKGNLIKENKNITDNLTKNDANQPDRSDIEREQQRHSQSNLSKLPPCPGLGNKWHNCVGYYTYSQGLFVGEYKNNLRHGQGVFTAKDGKRLEGIWEDDKFIRDARVNLPNLNNNEPDNSSRSETRRELKRQNQRINLQITHTQPTSDGSVTINIQTKADTASLLINGEEQGGNPSGDYVIKKVARAGQDTKFTITATDINGNKATQTISVSRSVTDSAPKFAALDPSKVKPRQAPDAVAIIIGIQNYKRVPKADFANDDARLFYDYAIRALGIKPENIKLLIDEQADEVEILSAFQSWLPVKVKKSKTDVYVFYSGHGLPSDDGKNMYILPFGADKQFIDRTALNQQEIVRSLQSVEPKSVTMFMDACYSGQIRTGDLLLASSRPLVPKVSANSFPPEFTVFTASSPDQIASSSPALKHGIFSYYVMKGMEGDADENKDGKITVDELHTYLAEMVSKQALTLNRKQSPQLIGTSGKVLVNQ